MIATADHSRYGSARRLVTARLLSALLVAASLLLAISPAADAATLKQRAYQVALAQLGDPFRYNAQGPDAFDCSGLTRYSYKVAGKLIKRTTYDQYRYSTRAIASSSRQPGDLVFFLSHGTPVHVGVYAGKDYMIHANSGSYYGRKVIKERITGYWTRHYAVRYRAVR